MALVPHYRGLAIWKRKTSKSRPSWARGFVPGSSDSRRAYEIAARNEKKFARAYLDAVGSLMDEKLQRDFTRAWTTGSIQAVMNSIPLFADDVMGNETWTTFIDSMRKIYRGIAQETSNAVSSSINRDFGREVIFDYVEKEAAPTLFVRTVPVNPNSLKWIDQRALKLIKEGMSKQQREVVRQIIEDSFQKGLHSVDAFRTIKDNIGLTSREYGALENRRASLEEAGFQPDDIKSELNAYRDELHEVRAKRIARTETIFAESKGRQESWKAAQESGALPKVQRMWVSPPPSPSPNNPCAICLSLDGKMAEIDGTYDSEELDEPVEGPPAHPNCRCTETIVPVMEDE